MAQFYLRVVAEHVRKNRIAAVCFQPIVEGRPSCRLTVLLSDEWGEKEVLRKMMGMGIFEVNDSFVAIGPELAGNLSLLVERASHFGLLRWGEGEKADYLAKKPLQAGIPLMKAAEAVQAEETRSHKSGGNKALIERLQREAESFFKARLISP